MALSFSLHVVKAVNAKCRGLLCQLEGRCLLKGDTVLEVVTVGHLARSEKIVQVRSFYCRRCATDAISTMKDVIEWQRGHQSHPISKVGLLVQEDGYAS